MMLTNPHLPSSLGVTFVLAMLALLAYHAWGESTSALRWLGLFRQDDLAIVLALMVLIVWALSIQLSKWLHFIPQIPAVYDVGLLPAKERIITVRKLLLFPSVPFSHVIISLLAGLKIEIATDVSERNLVALQIMYNIADLDDQPQVKRLIEKFQIFSVEGALPWHIKEAHLELYQLVRKYERRYS